VYVEERPTEAALSSLLPDDRLNRQTLAMIKEQMESQRNIILETTQACLGLFGNRVICRSAEGSAADTICDTAGRESFDLIVVGNCGKGMIRRTFLGSVSYKVANQAKVPVLIVRGKD